MRCSVCGSDRLSPLGELRTARAADTASTRLRLLFQRPGVFRSRPGVDIGFARACLDCGAVIPFLGEGARRQLTGSTELVGVDDRTGRHFDEDADEWVD